MVGIVVVANANERELTNENLTEKKAHAERKKKGNTMRAGIVWNRRCTDRSYNA